MSWEYLTIAGSAVLAIVVLVLAWTVLRLRGQEPYATFVRLLTRRKVTLFKLLLRDHRVPLFLKLLPLVVIVYIVSPVDLLPGIILDDIALALLTLAVIMSFAPREVLSDLARRFDEAD